MRREGGAPRKGSARVFGQIAGSSGADRPTRDSHDELIESRTDAIRKKQGGREGEREREALSMKLRARRARIQECRIFSITSFCIEIRPTREERFIFYRDIMKTLVTSRRYTSARIISGEIESHAEESRYTIRTNFLPITRVQGPVLQLQIKRLMIQERRVLINNSRCEKATFPTPTPPRVPNVGG